MTESNLRTMILKATELVQGGKLGQATAVIRQALWPSTAPSRTDGADRPAAGEDASVEFRTGFRSTHAGSPSTPPSMPQRGDFVEAFLEPAARRGRYRLFVPATAGRHRPLVVLLHGCTQDPDDFAAGTGMNRRADEEGFYVLYPAQSASANPSRCWNWFRREDQQRDGGEPAMIAAMIAAVIARCGIDPARVYIAGLSAGGAMAAIVASRYPELFAALGVQSGLMDGAATNLPDALAVMRTGAMRGAAKDTATLALPTIVFHGDRDTTVHPANGQSLVAAAVRGAGPLTEHAVTEPVAGRRKSFTRVEYRSTSGKNIVESWVVHGGPHAWSGGHAEGNYTDPDGPSATDEMLRFFLAHRRSSR